MYNKVSIIGILIDLLKDKSGIAIGSVLLSGLCMSAAIISWAIQEKCMLYQNSIDIGILIDYTIHTDWGHSLYLFTVAAAFSFVSAAFIVIT